MEQPEIFKAVLGLILPEIEVEKLTSLETEKPFTVDYFFHGVRFDVLAKGHERFVDIEVQLLDTGELRRTCYVLLKPAGRPVAQKRLRVAKSDELQALGRKLCDVLLQIRPVWQRVTRVQL